MNKRLLILSIILILLITILLIFFINFQKSLTGKVIYPDYNLRTKAICNETHCQDYEILCNDNQIISQKPITESIEKPINWTDPRNQKVIKNLCE